MLSCYVVCFFWKIKYKRYNFMFIHMFNIIGCEWYWKRTRSVLSIVLLNAHPPRGLMLCRGRSLTGQRIKTLSRIITILLFCYAANKISVDATVTACYIMLCHVTPTLRVTLGFFLFYSKSVFLTQSTILPQNQKIGQRDKKKRFISKL